MRFDAEKIYTGAINVCLPDSAVRAALSDFDMPKGALILVAIGKAAFKMAKSASLAIEEKGGRIDRGVVLTKYTGSRGKGGTNDASAEYIGWLRGILAKDGVVWQSGELGKVDCGGGGTVAKFVSKHNIEVVDLGVPVIAMHAPCEVISKVDLYEAHRAFCAYCKY